MGASEIKETRLGTLFRIEAIPARGFNFSFFLYVPEEKNKIRNLMIVPNNTTGSSSDFAQQLETSQRQALVEASIAERTSSILLVPGFPGPEVEPPLYTHSLSRSTLLVKNGPLKRIDIQLIKMAETASQLLTKKHKIIIRKKFLLSGFSASAMFVNRFTFIHPDLVAGVAIGAPGGWPIAPIGTYKGKPLPFPVGVSDVSELIGNSVNWDHLKKVHFFFFLGDKDENDSVIHRDSYTKEDEDLIFSNFGKKPVERWPVAERLYSEAGLNAHFKLYKDTGHETNQETRNDVVEFFKAIPIEQ
jgi:predicted esterase